ncbi:YolD-like family protein [Paenibacillus thalictri]|uniref:YolD-like family protein n=1 Tax=Paenibacillus thalictri TaxID=2527873 RepID=A0A4Q9DYS5_9BACL|nr:YolD-like family protein [Paenibacillus thalictri]TBL81048.1 hypothetical protein EYB31_02845 [Paenibacillus thalictri]
MSTFHNDEAMVSQIVQSALSSQEFVTVKLYNECGDSSITGLIIKFDREQSCFKLSHEDGIDTIYFHDILSIGFATGE